MNRDKLMDNIRDEKQRLSNIYKVPTSSIVWAGKCNFIIVK